MPSEVHENLVQALGEKGFRVPRRQATPTLRQHLTYFIARSQGWTWSQVPRCHRGFKECNCRPPEGLTEDLMSEIQPEEQALTGKALVEARHENTEILERALCSWKSLDWEYGGRRWPKPDAWMLCEDRRMLIVAEVDVTHRAPAEKYLDLWWLLDTHQVRLHLVRINQDGVLYMDDLTKLNHPGGVQALPTAPEAYDKVFAELGLSLSWPMK